jgi:hypothetical protein
MKDSIYLNSYSKKLPSNVLARKKNIGSLAGLRKNKIELAFIDVESQLKQLGQIQDLKQAGWFVYNIRNHLSELYNKYIYYFDVRNFASHEPGDNTPLNSECC